MGRESEQSFEAATVWDFSKIKILNFTQTFAANSIPNGALAISPLDVSATPQTKTGPLALLGTLNVAGLLTAAGTVQAGFFVGDGSQLTNVKSAGWASVKDFGAIGNGTADDTASIQNAVNSANSTAVWFPPGSYKITSTIVLRAGTSLLGTGNASQIVAATLNMTMFSFGGPVAHIDANGLFLTTSVAAGGVIGFKFTTADFTRITNCTFAGLLSNITYDRGTFHMVANCLSLGTATPNNKAGSLNILSSIDTGYVFAVKVTNYIVKNIGNGVQSPAVYVRRGVGVHLVNIDVNDMGGATAVLFENDCQGCKLSSSIFANVSIGVFFSVGAGVVVSPSFTVVSSVDVDQPITGGIYLGGANWVTITGCNITAGPTTSIPGIVLTGSSSNNSITGNTIQGFSTGSGNAISVGGSCNNNLISGNRVDNCLFFIGWSPSPTGTMIVNNLISLTAGGAGYNTISNAGVNTIVRGNYGDGRAGLIATPGMAASANNFINSTATDVTVYINANGGTITLVSVQNQSTGFVGGQPYYTVRVPAGGVIAVTYTGSPLWRWFADT